MTTAHSETLPLAPMTPSAAVLGQPAQPRRGGCRLLAFVAAALALLVGCSSEETTGPTTPTAVGGTAGAGGDTGGSAGTGGMAGAGGEGGSVTATGAIVPDPDDPAWLAYEGGASYYLCAPGDPEGFLYRGTRNPDGTRDGDQLDLIDKLAPTGSNGIYMIAVRSHGGGGTATENPFIDSNPTNGLDQDILAQWEIWFTAMDQAGITIYFFFYDNDASIWSTGDTVGPEEQAFIEGLVDAFEHHDHLIWVVSERALAAHSAPRISNLAAAIRTADDRDHAIAVSQFDTTTFDFADDAHVDQFAMQIDASAAAQIHSDMVGVFTAADGAYNLNLSGATGIGVGADARRRMWAVALGGAYVMPYEWDIESTAVSDLEDCGRLREFMAAADLTGMAPHDELAWGATQYVLAVPGERYVAYANAPTGDMGLATLPARTWNLSWFDAVTGVWEHESVTTQGGGDATFPQPASLGDEVAVYVR